MSGSASPYRPPNSASRRGTPFRRPGVANYDAAAYLAETERQLSLGMSFEADTNDIMPISETEAILNNIALIMRLPLTTPAEQTFSQTVVVNSIAMHVGQNSSTMKGHESNELSATFVVTDMPVAPMGQRYQILTDAPEGDPFPIARHIVSLGLEDGSSDGSGPSQPKAGGALTSPLRRAVPDGVESCRVTNQCRVAATFGEVASTIKGVRRNGTFRQLCRSIADRIGLYWLVRQRYNDSPKLFKTYMADEEMRDVIATFDGSPWKVLDIAPYYTNELLGWDDNDDRVHEAMLKRLRDKGRNSVDAARSSSG